MEKAPAPVQRHAAVARSLHPDAHRLDRGQGGCHVGAVGEAVDDRGALGQGGQ